MIIHSPEPSDIGMIKQLEDVEKLIEQRKRENPFGNAPIAELLHEKEVAALELVAREQRPQLLKDMRSKNNSAKRRAKKKIADASRRRNRK